MGWNKHTPDLTRRPGKDWSPVTASLIRRAFQPAFLSITFKRQGWEELGFQPYDRVMVLVGDGEHRGRIRLNRSADGVCELRPRALARSKDRQVLLVANLGRIAGLPDQAVKSLAVAYEKIDDGYVEITLPDWARLAEAARPAPAKDMSPRAVHARLMGRPGL